MPERQTRAVVEFLSGLDDEDTEADRKLPKVISPAIHARRGPRKRTNASSLAMASTIWSMWTRCVIVDVEATPARTYEEVAATKTDDRSNRDDIRPEAERLTADTAYGTAGCWLGSWTRTLRRIFRCGKDTNGLMACSPGSTSLTTPRATAISVPTAGH